MRELISLFLAVLSLATFQVLGQETQQPAQTTFTVEFPGRHAFRRGEADASLQIQVKADKPDIQGAKLSFTGQDGLADFNGELTFANGVARLAIPLRTNLLPGAYPCSCTVTAETQGAAISETSKLELHIGPQLDGAGLIRFFWMLGFYYYDEVRDAGFSHILRKIGDYNDKSNDLFASAIPRRLAAMDQMLADGVTFLESFQFSRSPGLTARFPRLKRDGTKVTDNMDTGHPELRPLISEAARRNAAQVGDHPAFGGLLTASEVRDASCPSFTDYNARAFKQATGLDVPQDATGRTAPHYSRLDNFPYGLIIPLDYPLLQFYSWFWKTGDGWNDFQSLVSDAFHRTLKQPIFTFYDPSVRVPPLYGSGGGVDYLNQWTYVYPEPFNISYVISEQQAMARGREGQGVITMLQGISYRSVLAPKEQKVANPPAWLEERPNTVYMTTPPDLLREGLWATFSRQLDGIGVFAWRAFFDAAPYGVDPKAADYQFTNPEAIKVVSDLLHSIAIPFGPLFRTVPERAPEIAVLESYASTFFAGRGTWGWQGQVYDLGTMLVGAGFSPYVLYEEVAAKGIPETIQVIVAPHCDVLTAPTYEALKQFQLRGGILVADDFLTPALLPDLTLPSFARKQQGMVDKLAMQDAARQLKTALAAYYRQYADTDNQDIFAHVRTYKDADYLFVINDKREFGDYIGQWGRVLERGVPNQGLVTVNRSVGAVYDLVRHCAVPFELADGKTSLKTAFDTNDGKIFLLTSRPLSPLAAETPKTIARGEAFDLLATSPDTDVIVPISLEIILADGLRLDNSGAGIVKDGEFTRRILIP
ncbi:MAG: hypothetical protein J6866_08590, partial [Victivallales bacterium]|nr:hypothetical protein [Victivallales bacterium]